MSLLGMKFQKNEVKGVKRYFLEVFIKCFSKTIDTYLFTKEKCLPVAQRINVDTFQP